MAVLVVGLNHESSPLAIREQLHFSEDDKKDLEMKLVSIPSIKECIILSTCNRTEVYTVSDHPQIAECLIKNHLLSKVNKDPDDLVKAFYVKVNDEAVIHLFKVVCGLNSLVIGETRILGQVKEAFFNSQRYGCTGNVFNRLFKQAITLGKKARTNTGIDKNTISVSYAAIQLLKKYIFRLESKKILIIGAGIMSNLTVRHLKSEGCTQLFFVNRTFDTAAELAESFNGIAYPMEDCLNLIEQVDIVICAVNKRSYLLHFNDVLGFALKRKNPLYLIDLGVPRNIDPKIAKIKNVHLYDMDHFNGIIESNCQLRINESHKINKMIKKEVVEFHEWKKMLPAIPLIQKLQEKSAKIQAEAIRNIENKLPDLTEREKQVIVKFTKMISNQLTRQPILMMKEIASKEDHAKRMEYLGIASRLLGLESEFKPDEEMAQIPSSELLKYTGS